MKNINKVFLFIALLVVLALSVYSFQIKKQSDLNKAKIDELSTMVIAGKAMSMDNKIKYEKHDLLIEKLHKDYISRKKFDIHPNYIKYKKQITLLIDKQIASIVNETPLQQGTWILSKVEFINPEFVYVEYEDGHGLSATFIQITKAKKGYTFKAIY